MKTRDLGKPVYIVQFNDDGKRVRCVSAAFVEGPGDILEDCYFRVTAASTQVTVEAEPSVKSYLENEYHSNVEAWEDDIIDYLDEDYDLFLNPKESVCTDGWSPNGLHFTTDLDWYRTEGYIFDDTGAIR